MIRPELEGWWFDKLRSRFVLGVYPLVYAWIGLREAAEGAQAARRLENPDPYLVGLEYLMDHIKELTR